MYFKTYTINISKIKIHTFYFISEGYFMNIISGFEVVGKCTECNNIVLKPRKSLDATTTCIDCGVVEESSIIYFKDLHDKDYLTICSIANFIDNFIDKQDYITWLISEECLDIEDKENIATVYVFKELQSRINQLETETININQFNNTARSLLEEINDELAESRSKNKELVEVVKKLEAFIKKTNREYHKFMGEYKLKRILRYENIIKYNIMKSLSSILLQKSLLDTGSKLDNFIISIPIQDKELNKKDIKALDRAFSYAGYEINLNYEDESKKYLEMRITIGSEKSRSRKVFKHSGIMNVEGVINLINM